MVLVYVIIWGFVLLAGATAVAALAWSIRDGQWRATEQDASVIFRLDDTQSGASSKTPGAALSVRGE